jgi:hypothetical protein
MKLDLELCIMMPWTPETCGRPRNRKLRDFLRNQKLHFDYYNLDNEDFHSSYDFFDHWENNMNNHAFPESRISLGRRYQLQNYSLVNEDLSGIIKFQRLYRSWLDKRKKVIASYTPQKLYNRQICQKSMMLHTPAK